MKLTILDKSGTKTKENDAKKAASMVMQFVQEFNINSENKYINFSLKNILELR